MPVLLLLLFTAAMCIGLGVIALLVRRARSRSENPAQAQEGDCPFGRTCVLRRPGCWLAIRSRNLLAVQAALGLQNAKPCSWIQGLNGDEALFIAPPVRGWILVLGTGLPDPTEDVDACFRFVTGLSRKIGHVQYFYASRILHHHAWVQADRGRILRAYAWAGHTVWKQGKPTAAEKELDVKCYDYTDSLEQSFFGQPDPSVTNVDKVPLLAARWSIDPGRIDERYVERERGIAGELSRRF